jgi:predicted phage tail component-like protein
MRDGIYDFSESNELGRETYNERVFTVTVSVCEDDIYKMQTKLSKLSLWLRGSGELIFDDMPLTVWKGSVSDEIVYMPEHGGKTAQLEVSFSAEPFSYGIFGTEGPILDSETITLDNSIPIGIDEVYTFTVSKNADIHILNFGDCPMRPVINITSSVIPVWLTMNGKTLFFYCSGSVDVDFEKRDVTDENGRINVTGDFFEFASGENILNIKSTSTKEMTVTVSFRPRFMYGASYDDVEWSVNHA